MAWRTAGGRRRPSGRPANGWRDRGCRPPGGWLGGWPADGRVVARADARRDGWLCPACDRVGGRPPEINSRLPGGQLFRRPSGRRANGKADGRADFHQSERPSATPRVQNSPICWTVELLSWGKVDEVLMSQDITTFRRTCDVPDVGRPDNPVASTDLGYSKMT